MARGFTGYSVSFGGVTVNFGGVVVGFMRLQECYIDSEGFSRGSAGDFSMNFKDVTKGFWDVFI